MKEKIDQKLFKKLVKSAFTKGELPEWERTLKDCFDDEKYPWEIVN